MGKKIIILLNNVTCFICICVSSFIHSQDLSIGERKYLLKATSSLYQANSLNSSVVHYYVGGNSEFFFDDKYSFRGDIYSLIGEKNDFQQSMWKTAQLSAGFNRCFSKKRWSPFIGLYTGVTRLHIRPLYESYSSLVPDLSHPTIQYVPHVGINLGVQYYFYKYFHFFGEARYIHQLNPFEPTFLDEISMSAGLGFQIPLKK